MYLEILPFILTLASKVKIAPLVVCRAIIYCQHFNCFVLLLANVLQSIVSRERGSLIGSIKINHYVNAQYVRVGPFPMTSQVKL